MFENKTYDVNCPACGVKNTLKRADLGVSLNCGACSAQFRYDEPLKREKFERERAEKKRKAEAKARREAERDRVKAEKAKQAAEDQAYRDRQDAAERKARYEAEQRAREHAQQRLQYSGGCQRCGSTNIRQVKYTTPAGWGLFVIGLLGALCTTGLSLILCAGAAVMRGDKSICQDCKYVWRAV